MTMDMPFSDLAFCAIHFGKVSWPTALARKSFETAGTSYDRPPNRDGPPMLRRLSAPSGLAPIIQASCQAAISVLTTKTTVSPGFASHTSVVDACSRVVGRVERRFG